MSANDKLLIIKDEKKGCWIIRHIDMDGCYNNKIGEKEILEEAIAFANKWEEEQGSPEYGLEIIGVKYNIR